LIQELYKLGLGQQEALLEEEELVRDPCKELYLMQELRKLGLGREALLEEEELVLDPGDPVGAVKLRFLPTGNYLRPCDMEYCVSNTNFSEDEIFQWFKSFRLLFSISIVFF
jgi:hypothetical protein